MKPHQDDPRLTAYLLGELPPEEAAAVERAVAADPALRDVLEDAGQMRERLEMAFGSGRETLQPAHRQNIRNAAKEVARAGKVERLRSHRKTRNNWLMPLAAAAVLAVGLFFLTTIPDPENKGNKGVTSNPDPAMQVREGTAAPPPSGNVTRLPLEAGKRSLAQITTAIRADGRLPETDEVRIEEMLNAFPLKAKGSAALWKGCTLAAEVLPCPWKPSASLIVINVQGARDDSRELSVSFRASESEFSSHDLLGYANGNTGEISEGDTRLAAGSSNLLVMEASGNDPRLGELIWTVDGTEAPAISLIRNEENEPSDDARFAALICGFGLWLRGEEKPAVDDLLVLGLAREVAAESLVADRYDFLNLVDQAVKIAEEK